MSGSAYSGDWQRCPWKTRVKLDTDPLKLYTHMFNLVKVSIFLNSRLFTLSTS